MSELSAVIMVACPLLHFGYVDKGCKNMKKTGNRTVLSLICVLTLTAVTSVTFAETGKAPDPKAVKTGKALYVKHCQACHQKDGVGQQQLPLGIRRPGYIPAMPLNETSHAWHHGDEQLVATILSGIKQRGMPSFRGTLSELDAINIVAYVKSLWPPKILDCQGPKHMSCM